MIDEHARATDSLAAYALGALESPEREATAAHVAGCLACQRELAEYTAVVALLPAALPEVAPPPAARDALLARARASAPAPARPTPRRAPPEPSKFPFWLMAWWEALRPVRWAAVGGLVAVLLAWNVMLQLGRPAAPPVDVGVLAGGQIVTLVGTGVPSASARLYLQADGQRATLVVTDLPVLPAGRTYQLWFARRGQTPQSGGIFQVNARGEVLSDVRLPARLDAFEITAVTEEPAGGSPRPTGAHLLDGEF